MLVAPPKGVRSNSVIPKPSYHRSSGRKLPPSGWWHQPIKWLAKTGLVDTKPHPSRNSPRGIVCTVLLWEHLSTANRDSDDLDLAFENLKHQVGKQAEQLFFISYVGTCWQSGSRYRPGALKSSRFHPGWLLSTQSVACGNRNSTAHPTWTHDVWYFHVFSIG